MTNIYEDEDIISGKGSASLPPGMTPEEAELIIREADALALINSTAQEAS